MHCYFVNNTTIGKLNNLIAFMEFKTNHVYTVFAIFVAYETQAMSQEIRKVTSNTKVKATTKKNVRYSSNSTRTSNKQATQPNLISKISQLQLSHKMSKEVPQTNQHTDVDCSHQCIGCRPACGVYLLRESRRLVADI